MQTVGELFKKQRNAKSISIHKASRDLLIKERNLEQIEDGDWENLPEPPFTKGFIKNYANYLGLDADRILATYRREYDEARYPHKKLPIEAKKRLMLTPNKMAGLGFILLGIAFISYLIFHYLSIRSAPKLEVLTPADDLTTHIEIIQVRGVTEISATVAIDGEFVPVDQEGNFFYQIHLKEGRNVIEIISSKRLSPKSKVTKVVRLSR
ncbi:hypothetical protein A3F02_01320 [Candidatus Curtissbacteria bacterium RIFCSPHIGHO2_12_FULL_38_9b]|uniref:HTH cro/C1-type domain-containing protein n=2 Tax=Candidatus Curtissiibacteriota TaxID=1752717 RepID=A0A1F5GZZ3_9BACT|nr:MAG: hypothetical protein A3A48_00145 [Candidatus Curtissbacteria bacterium RIFCSPLOWO2_01_FULL_37_9]OGD97433.1 MAG: hypothetical protein A3F02_01320 [Candidatus Curtissbacteria bacterium RIFCSPHIGHO2_12_FULL_38_9b]